MYPICILFTILFVVTEASLANNNIISLEFAWLVRYCVSEKSQVDVVSWHVRVSPVTRGASLSHISRPAQASSSQQSDNSSSGKHSNNNKLYKSKSFKNYFSITEIIY